MFGPPTPTHITLLGFFNYCLLPITCIEPGAHPITTFYLSDVIVCKLAMHIAEMPQHIIGSVSETKAVSVK
jgi:hypothetical protein